MSIQKYQTGAIALLWITTFANAIGQTHESHSGAMSHAHESIELPMETGQSAFAAIAEIVALLENDPQTDWSTIDINGLRNHLVDMNQLTLSALVTTQELDEQTIQFHVAGPARTLQAVQRMVPKHAHMVSNSTTWDIEVTSETAGVTLKITTHTAADYTKLKALGFFGFMTIGAHHQLHHLQMAKGAGH